MKTSHWPTGSDLIEAYKKTKAVPDYDVYWESNGHLHACAIGVMNGAGLGKGIGEDYDAQSEVRSRGRFNDDWHISSNHLLFSSLYREDESLILTRCWEMGVKCSDTRKSVTKWLSGEGYRRSLDGYDDYVEYNTTEMVEAFMAGYSAWTVVISAVARGELPDKRKKSTWPKNENHD